MNKNYKKSSMKISKYRHRNHIRKKIKKSPPILWSEAQRVIVKKKKR
jgi:hypothetical protein